MLNLPNVRFPTEPGSKGRKDKFYPTILRNMLLEIHPLFAVFKTKPHSVHYDGHYLF